MQFVRPLQIDNSGQRNRSPPAPPHAPPGTAPTALPPNVPARLRGARRSDIASLSALTTDMRSEYPKTLPAIRHPAFPTRRYSTFAVAIPLAVRRRKDGPNIPDHIALANSPPWMQIASGCGPFDFGTVNRQTDSGHSRMPSRIGLRCRQIQNVIAQ